MTEDKGPVHNYILTRNNVMEYFHCKGDFFLKPLIHLHWTISDREDFFMLSYWNTNGKKTDAVIVKKNGKPMVFTSGNFTMVVGIDCVKIGFIFNNDLKK